MATTFARLHLVLDGRAMLSCSCDIPDGWVNVPLPNDAFDFDNPRVFLPLLVAMAPYGSTTSARLRPRRSGRAIEPTFDRLLASFELDEMDGITAAPLRLMTSEPSLELRRVVDNAAEPPVLESRQPDAEVAGEPDWWRDAVLLERADRLEEAEQTVLKAVNHLGGFSSVARLYEERFARFSAAGQKEAADAAKERAIDWLDVYASMATSGGEGTALANERDRRIVALGDSPRRR